VADIQVLVTMKLMTEVTQYIRNNKLLVLLDFLLIALFFSPYSVTRETSWVDGTEMWQNNPVYSDEFMLICFVPLLILTLIYQVFKETLLGKVSLIFALISRSLRTIQPIDFYHNFVENLVV
jgi:hypothetical protein